MNYSIGDTAYKLDKPQSIRGDFLWTLELVDVAEDGTETPKDLTDFMFVMEFFEMDGTTQKELLNVGAGITITDNIVSITLANEDFNTWRKGCKFPYYLTMESADGFNKCLFEGAFIPG